MNRLRWFTHNCIAHPLLFWCPPVGRWVHDATVPDEEIA